MILNDDPRGLSWIAYEDDVVKVTCDTDQFTFKVMSKDKSFRGKTFKGESAWSSAQRYVNDKVWDHRAYW